MLYHYGSDVFPCLHEAKEQDHLGSAAVQPVLSFSRKQIQKSQRHVLRQTLPATSVRVAFSNSSPQGPRLEHVPWSLHGATSAQPAGLPRPHNTGEFS